MQRKLWINRWNDKRKASAVRKQEVGIGFLSNYQMTDFHKVLYNLQVGLETTKGSNTSSYVTFIPPSGNEVVKVRLSDHPSTIEEWEPNELTGLPNRRYSIVIFSNKSMPNESKQKLKELNWKCYKSQNIPVYEKTFNRYYLKETFPKLISILQTIYKGGAPEDKSLPVNITENNQQINENKTMNKKQTIRLNESQLRRILSESVKKVLNEIKTKERKQLYDHGDILAATNIVTHYVYDKLKPMGKQAIPILYAIAPDSTAIGNDGVFDGDWDSIRNSINRNGLAYDGNRGFTLLDIAKMIENGDFK